MRKDNWKVAVNGKGTPVNDIINKFWFSRGIENPETFLRPSGNIFPAQCFQNIDKAVATFNLVAHSPNPKFVIYADVDADGCSSAAILYHYLTALGIEAEVYINKKKEHGIKDEFFDIDRNEDCVIVVDSINDSMEQYEKIWAQGKQLIILDHHIPNAIIRENAAALNLVSSALDYPNPHLSGSGVTWKFVKYLDHVNGTNIADNLVDLASVGIIADVCSVGLDSMENREICDFGFRNLQNCGIRAVVNADEMNSESIGFSIAPLVNAANRMNENRLALDLFLCDSISTAKSIVKDLTKIKEKQKVLAAELFENFESMVVDQVDNHCYYFMIDESYGTLGGLLATKASDKWKRPCIVVHDTPLGYAGSMRATGVENFSKIVNDSGLGECAGHENSAGIVIPKENFDSFKQHIEAELTNLDFTPTLDVDLYLERMQITPFLLTKVKEINRITGPGFPSVSVCIENIKNYNIKKLSQGKHLCVETSDMKFLMWNFTKWDDVCDDGVLHAIGSIDESFFMGKRTNQMLMQDYIFQAAPKVTALW